MTKWLIVAITALFSVAGQAQTFQPILQPHQYFLNGSGNPCAGCQLFSYAAGTTTPQATYTDSSGSVQNTNPVVLDAAGSAAIWVGTSSYKFSLVDTNGTVLWTVDNVTTPGGGSQTAYMPVAGGTFTGAVNGPTVNNTQVAIFKNGTDYGATVNAAIAATAAAGGATGFGRVVMPPGNYSFSTPISLVGYPNITLDCQGANLTYNGSASPAVDSLQTGSSAQIISTGGIENCNIYAPNSPLTNQVLFRMGNVLYYHFRHNAVFGYNAAGDTGLLVENTQYFTEESVIEANHMRSTIGYELESNCTPGFSACTGSFEYTFFKSNYWGPNTTTAASVGLLLTGGADLQNSVVELHGNLNGTVGGDVVQVATSSDVILRDQIAIQAEKDGTPTTAVCVANSGTFIANGTLVCDGMNSTGNTIFVFGADSGQVGDESLSAGAKNVAVGSVAGTGDNILPDSEFLLGSAYWNTGTITGNFETGTSQANTGHTDFGYWNTSGSPITCSSGSMFSQSLTLPPGTYTISAGFATSGTTTTGCGTSFEDVTINGVTPQPSQFGLRNPASPVTFTITVATVITWEFQYAGFNIAPGGYIAWYAPQIEQGSQVTAYKQSTFGGFAPQFQTLTAGTVNATGSNGVQIAGTTVIPGTTTGHIGSGTTVLFGQSATTGSIGGGALAAGACATGTATIGASATGHPGIAAASDGTVQGNYTVQVSVSGTTATVSVCAITAGTPTAKTYNVNVF